MIYEKLGLMWDMIGNTNVYKEFMDYFLLTRIEAWESLLFPKKTTNRKKL